MIQKRGKKGGNTHVKVIPELIINMNNTNLILNFFLKVNEKYFFL